MFKIGRRTVILVCSAGMSTSSLVTKMQKAAEAKEVETDIFVVSASDADNQLESKSVDVSLSSPRVRFMQNQFAEKLVPKGIPSNIINMVDYDMMNSEKVPN